MVGRTISRYEILEKLGAGGMGEVFRAQDTTLERTVALKFLAQSLLDDPEAKQRFLREAKAAASLDHPNICTVYEVAESEGRSFLALAYLPGQPLDKLIANGPLPLPDLLATGRQIADGLAAAHQQNVIHRDIKPANIMIGDDGRATIMDFGLARLTEASRLTKPEQTLGTAAYMSPEQLQGADADHRTDIWSLGCVLYEMTAGRTPFPGEYPQALAYEILNQEPEPLTAIRTGVPRELEFIIAKCLAKAPEERYLHADELARDLAAQAKRLESGATPSPSPAAPPRDPRPFGIAIAVALAVVLCAFVLFDRPAPPPSRPSYALRQLTFDSGLTFQPSLTNDGKLVAYASDRSGEGNLDIWVQQRNGSQPIRLTTDPADDLEPDFSPDGTRVAFRSHREPQGVYLIETLGGEPRLVAPGGLRPRFSPSGEWIAYHDGAGAYLVPPDGGQPRELRSGLVLSAYPTWLSDSLLVIQGNERLGSGVEWWTYDIESDQAEPLDIFPLVAKTGMSADAGPNSAVPGRYLEPLGGVALWDPTDARTDLWLLPIRPDGSAPTPVIPLTVGAGRFAEADASSSADLITASVSKSYDIWRIPLDAASGKTLGPPESFISEESLDVHPVVSRDGRLVSWSSNRSGNWDGWLLELPSGAPRRLTLSPEPWGNTSISADGGTVSFVVGADYRTRRDTYRGIGVMKLPSGGQRMICSDCGRLNGVAPDGSAVLSWVARESGVEILHTEVSTAKTTTILSRDGCRHFNPRFSLDGKWISFQSDCDYAGQDAYIAPYRGAVPIPESDWVRLGDRPERDPQPRLSPNGGLVYFLSDRDGFLCLWARSLHPATKHPTADPFPVSHFHQFRTSLNNMPAGLMGLSLTDDYLYLALSELTGNVWLMEPR